MWRWVGSHPARCDCDDSRPKSHQLRSFRASWTTRIRRSPVLSFASGLCRSVWVCSHLAGCVALHGITIHGGSCHHRPSPSPNTPKSWSPTLFGMWRWVGSHPARCDCDDSRPKSHQLRSFRASWTTRIRRSPVLSFASGLCRSVWMYDRSSLDGNHDTPNRTQSDLCSHVAMGHPCTQRRAGIE